MQKKKEEKKRFKNQEGYERIDIINDNKIYF